MANLSRVNRPLTGSRREPGIAPRAREARAEVKGGNPEVKGEKARAPRGQPVLPPAGAAPLAAVPENRTEALAAAQVMQERARLLRRISAEHLRHLARPFFAAGWSPRDLLHAIDHEPGGRQHALHVRRPLPRRMDPLTAGRMVRPERRPAAVPQPAPRRGSPPGPRRPGRPPGPRCRRPGPGRGLPGAGRPGTGDAARPAHRCPRFSPPNRVTARSSPSVLPCSWPALAMSRSMARRMSVFSVDPASGGPAQADRRRGRGQSQRPDFRWRNCPRPEHSTRWRLQARDVPLAARQLGRPSPVSHQRPPHELPARTTAAALLGGFPCSEEIGDLLGRHRLPKTVKCKPHDGAAADDLPASAAHVRVLAFTQPQVVLAIQPHLARLERERDVLRESGRLGLLTGCWSATRSPWRSWGCGCRYGWGPGGVGRRGRPGLGRSRRRRWRITVARNSQIDHLGAIVLRFRARRRGGPRMTWRKRPPGSAGLLLLDAFAQLSHRIPPRS